MDILIEFVVQIQAHSCQTHPKSRTQFPYSHFPLKLKGRYDVENILLIFAAPHNTCKYPRVHNSSDQCFHHPTQTGRVAKKILKTHPTSPILNEIANMASSYPQQPQSHLDLSDGSLPFHRRTNG